MQPAGWHEARGVSSEDSPPNWERGSEKKLSPAKARRLRSGAGRASPSGKGTAGERQAASAAGAGFARPLWSDMVVGGAREPETVWQRGLRKK